MSDVASCQRTSRRGAGVDKRLTQRPRLARVDALHTALTQSVLEGGDLDRIAAEVAGVLGVGILVTSTDGRERAAGGMSPDLRAALVTAGLVDPTGRLRVERASARRGPARTRRAAGAADRGRRRRPGPAGVRRPRPPIGPDDVHALERAATVAALVITREQAVAAVEDKYRGDFLRDVFLGRAGDPAYVARARRGLRLGPGPAGGRRLRRARPARSGGAAGVAARGAASGRSGSRSPGGR